MFTNMYVRMYVYEYMTALNYARIIAEMLKVFSMHYMVRMT